MKKNKEKKINNANRDQKVTNGLVKFWVIGGIAVLSLGVIGAAVAGIHRAVVETEKNKIYSVAFDLSKTNPKGTRLDDAKGLVAGINGEKNDFDNAYPWKAMKEVKDEHGDAFIRIPKFYQKAETNSETNIFTLSISSNPHKGFVVAPAFLKGEEEIDFIDIARYEASMSKEGKLRSVSGEMPVTTGYTLDQYRSIAESDGNQLFDWRGNQALQTLFMAEFATLDSQTIMAGETAYDTYAHELTAEEIAKGKIDTFADLESDERMLIDSEMSVEKFVKANQLHVDISFSHNDEDEEENNFSVEETTSASTIEFNNDKTSVDKVILSKTIDVSKMSAGETINIAFGSYNYHKTGSTDGKKGSSVGSSMKSGEIAAMSYRGIENWYGNTYTWADGLATYQDANNNKFICVSLDATKNSDRDSYKRYAEGSSLGDGIFMTKFDMDDEIEYQMDNYGFGYSSETYHIGYVGGGYGGGYHAGAFYLDVNSDVSLASYSVRLSCIPH